MTEVRITAVGDTIAEADLIEWIKDEAPVREGELIYSIQLDKSITEIESPANCMLKITEIPGKIF